MVAALAWLGLFSSGPSVATLVSDERPDQFIHSYTWRNVSARKVMVRKVGIADAKRYRFDFDNVGFVEAMSATAAIAYVQREDGATGFLVVCPDRSSEFVPVAGPVVRLHFLAGGNEFVALRQLGTRQSPKFESQVYAMRSGRPTLLQWSPSMLLSGSESDYQGVDGLATIGEAKPTSIDPRSARSQRFERLVRAVVRCAARDSRRYDPWLDPNDIEISPDDQFWWQKNLRVLSGGLNEFDPMIVADGLLSGAGLEWEWKRSGADPLQGAFFSDPEHFVFLATTSIDMGPPATMRHYPAGLYTIDLRLWRAVRSPLSNRILKLGRDAATIVALQ